MSTPDHQATRWGYNPDAVIDHTLADRHQVTDATRHGIRSITFTGVCPYCYGDFTYTVDITVVPSAGGLIGQGDSDMVLVLECTCAREHTSRPAGQLGCGQSWTVTLEEDAA